MKAKLVNESLNELYGKGWETTTTGYPFSRDKKEPIKIKDTSKTYRKWTLPSEGDLLDDLDNFAGSMDEWVDYIKSNYPQLSQQTIDNVIKEYKIITDADDELEDEKILNTASKEDEIVSNSRPYGYSTFKILDALYKAGEKGLRYSEMQKVAFEIANPGYTFDPIKNRGFWSTNLKIDDTTIHTNKYGQRMHHWFGTPTGAMGKYLRKEGNGRSARYFMNAKGIDKYKELKTKFE